MKKSLRTTQKKALWRVSIITAAICLLLSVNAIAQVPAYPGAQGGGATSVGGRGGVVIKVTNLNDSGSGSLRAAMEASGPRTVVFTVGGTINLTSPINVLNPYLTVAGQTAPGGGILLRGTGTTGACLNISTTDVVIRYLRVRHGFNSGCSSECGADIMVWKSGDGTFRRIVLDHLSVSWTQDESIGIWGDDIKDITVSWTIVSEGLNPHSTGLLAGGGAGSVNTTDVDVHHNLFINDSHRNPLLKIKRSRFVNNIAYNNSFYACQATGQSDADIIGNLTKKGPMYGMGWEATNPPNSSLWHEIQLTDQRAYGGSGTPSIFLSGNMGWNQTDPAGDQWLLTARIVSENVYENGAVVPAEWKRTTPLPNTTYPIVAEPVAGLAGNLIPIVGASRRLASDGSWVANRDAVDTRVINDYLTNTGITSTPHSENDVGGFPVIANGTPYADTDNDGMADVWETAQFGNLNQTNNGIAANGHTNLENFLEGSAATSAPAAPSNLIASPATSSVINLVWTDNSTNETGFEVDRALNSSFSSGFVSNAYTTGAGATGVAAGGLSASTLYYFRARATNGNGDSPNSNTASATTQAGGGGLPSPWLTQDIGAVGATGSASYDSGTGTFTIVGSGADIFSTADEFRYVYQAASGDCEIKARVATQGNTNEWAKAGVMIRETLAAGSMHAMMNLTPVNGAWLTYRNSTNGTSASIGNSVGAAPYWVRLVRSGSTFTGYKSTDGVTWTTVGSTTITMGASIYIGLPVTSHLDGTLNTSTFNNVNVVLPTVSVSATDASAAEAGLDPGTFTFTRAGATAAALTVNYTVSGTATSGTDYTSIGTSVAFAAGSATATKTVTPIQETTVEPTETVIVTLAAGTGYTVGSPNAATVNIADDDVGGLPSPWLTQDIGAVGATGSASYDSGTGTFTIVGSGADIFSTADEFRYVYQAASGDCEIKVRVATQANTDAWAKAGVMIRETLAAGSKHAMMNLTPVNGAWLTYRNSTNGTSASIGNSVGAAPYWVRLVRSGSTFTGYISTDGVTWTTVGSTTITMGASIYIGLPVTSHLDGTLNTSTFDNVSVSVLPSPWLTQDIGAVGATGSATYGTTGTFTIVGSGADIFSTADEFRYVYQAASGDCEIKARVATQGNTNEWAKAGVMIRETLAAGSMHAMMNLTPVNGAWLTYRNSTNGTSASIGNSVGAAPYWVRLVRSGSTFTGYKSTDGVTWTTVGSTTITMGASVYIGLPVTSHVDGTLNTSTFNNVNVILTKSATIPTGSGTLDNAEKLTVYPNPTNEFLTIELTGISGEHQIQIYNSIGSLVKVVKLTGSSQVDISGLPNGLYFIRLKNNSLKAQFIKQ